MLVFLDFEASSLSKRSYPIEVGWIFEDGIAESHLIRPTPTWTDWEPAAEAVHGISRATVERDGTPHDVVANRMVEALSGHDLLASAPSWDGKWLSHLLRSAGLPRHSLRLRDSDDVILDAARAAFADLPSAAAAERSADLVGRLRATVQAAPAHRALADAAATRELWLRVLRVAQIIAKDATA